MRKLFFVALLMMFHTLPSIEWTRQEIDESGQHAGRLSRKICGHIESQYGLQCCGSGLAMCGGPIRSIGLSFITHEAGTQSELRKLIVKCINAMVNIVNTDSYIEPYLFSSPFEVRNVRISIFVKKTNGQTVSSPSVGIVSLVAGNLYYDYFPPGREPGGPKRKVKETYEEALEAIRKEDEANRAHS